MVRLLLDHGASVDERDCSGWTPLLKACAAGLADVVFALLDRGADLAAKDDVSVRGCGCLVLWGRLILFERVCVHV